MPRIALPAKLLLGAFFLLGGLGTALAADDVPPSLPNQRVASPIKGTGAPTAPSSSQAQAGALVASPAQLPPAQPDDVPPPLPPKRFRHKTILPKVADLPKTPDLPPLPSSQKLRASPKTRLPSTYLLSMNYFGDQSFLDMDQSWLNQFENSPERMAAWEQSPFHGVAVMLTPPGSIAPLGSICMCRFKAFVLGRQGLKHIWPLLYFNRFVGLDPKGGDGGAKVSREERRTFEKIKGMDLYDLTGSLFDFKAALKKGLQLARKGGAPGIVLDPWPYNGPRNDNLAHLAKMQARSENEIRSRLVDIGTEFARIVRANYPLAIIWLTREPGQGAMGLIIGSMLQEARRTATPMTMVVGRISTLQCDSSSDGKSPVQSTLQCETLKKWQVKFGTETVFAGALLEAAGIAADKGADKGSIVSASGKVTTASSPALPALLARHRFVAVSGLYSWDLEQPSPASSACRGSLANALEEVGSITQQKQTLCP